MADRVVEREPVGDVAAGAVDIKRDRLAVVVGELTEPLDRAFGGVFLDVADKVDVAESIGVLLAEQLLDLIDELDEQAIGDFAHTLPLFARLVPCRPS
jgi:hypothetical protein